MNYKQKLKKTKELFNELKEEYDLDGWKFELGRGYRTSGYCSDMSKTIRISKHLIEQEEFDVFKNTIFHEIAHAIVGTKNHHNNLWREKFIELGGNGRRCSNYNLEKPYKYELTCENECFSNKFLRKPRKDYESSRYYCKTCKGRLQVKKLKEENKNE